MVLNKIMVILMPGAWSVGAPLPKLDWKLEERRACCTVADSYSTICRTFGKGVVDEIN